MAKYKAEFPEKLLKSMSQGHSFEASMADLSSQQPLKSRVQKRSTPLWPSF